MIIHKLKKHQQLTGLSNGQQTPTNVHQLANRLSVHFQLLASFIKNQLFGKNALGDSNSDAGELALRSRIAGELRSLIDQVNNEGLSADEFIQLLYEFEPVLNLYLIETFGSRVVLRYGELRQIVVVNRDFIKDMKNDEWCSYLAGRKSAIVNVLKTLHERANSELIL